MTSITIRGLEPELEARLRARATRHGRAIEDEAKAILRTALADADASPSRLGEAVHLRFRALRGAKLTPPLREPMRAPPDLG